MKRSDHPDRQSVSVYLLKALLDYARKRGVDTDSLAGAAGPGTPQQDDRQRIPLSRFNELWGRIAGLLHDPLMGLHFGESFARSAASHFLFVIMGNSPSLEKALQALMRYHGLMTDHVRPRLAVKGERGFLEAETGSGGEAMSGDAAETSLALLAQTLLRLTDGALQFTAVRLRRTDPGSPEEYRRVFGLFPVFGSPRDCLEFKTTELSKPLPLAQREFGDLLHHYSEILLEASEGTRSTGDQVLDLMKMNLLQGKETSLKGIAASCGTGGRCLQSRLKKEGTTFQVLLDRARREIALHFLRQEDVMLCDIAFLLGFSDQSSFNHAFRKWTGKTPGAFRNIRR